MTGSSEQSRIVEAYLLIEQPRQRLGHWTKALAPLDTPNAPPVSSIIAYYDATSDQALIDLQYDRAHANMKFVVDVALLAEVGMVQPEELSEGERVRFLSERLTRCTIRVDAHTSAAGALTELVRRIKDIRANKPATTQPPPIPQAALARSVSPRGDTDDPVMLVNAKGTRDNLEPVDPVGSGPEPPPPPRREQTAYEVLSSVDRHRTTPMPLELAQKLIGESSQMLDLRTLPKPPGRDSAPSLPLPAPPRTEESPIVRETVQEKTAPVMRRQKTTVRAKSPVPAEAFRERAPVPSESSRAVQLPSRHRTPVPRMPTEASRDPYLPTPGAPQLHNIIHARYLRGGRWVPVRVGALSLKGAALLAGALPRLNDRVDVALSFGSYRAIVSGIVLKVSTMREATQTGASTFSLTWELDDGMRRSLTNLLTAARDAKITIKPPPPRATRRFPVEWQVALGTIRGAVKAIALDVSAQGMFVQPAVNLEVGATLTFSIMLDDGTAPIAGRARVVRQIGEPEARQCGLLPGFGLLIVSMGEADRMRWLGFLARIERRADKRVLIGADPARLAELQAGLASLGYAVSGGTDPGALLALARSDARPADAVLIDAGWLQSETSASLESLFSQHNVPCLTMQGEVRRARQAIDQLLEVVV
jgi:hypothetical protein